MKRVHFRRRIIAIKYRTEEVVWFMGMNDVKTLWEEYMEEDSSRKREVSGTH